MHKSVLEFKKVIDTNSLLSLMLTKMIKVVDDEGDYPIIIETQQEFFDWIDDLLRSLPSAESKDMIVACPLSTFFNAYANTNIGKTFFSINSVNKALSGVLKEWCEYLDSEDSRFLLDKSATWSNDYWFSSDNLKKMGDFFNDYKHDPNDKYYGFKSWNHFFTRELNEGVRPLPISDKPLLVHACESITTNVCYDLKLEDTVNLKEQKYDLSLMLLKSAWVDYYTNGTLYQAFLSPYNYHRWHAPVSGTIVDIQKTEGAFFSSHVSVDYDEAVPEKSLVHISSVNSRCLIYIETEMYGTVCFMAIGMAEISGLDIFVNVGDYINAGDQMGTFKYGGSSYCLLFNKEIKLKLPQVSEELQKVNSKLGVE